MTEPYCGIGEISKKMHKGTPLECVFKNQVRLYGKHKVNSQIFVVKQNVTKLEKDINANRLLVSKLMGRKSRIKYDIKGLKNQEKKEKLKQEFSEIIDKLKIIVTDLNKKEADLKKIKKELQLN